MTAQVQKRRRWLQMSLSSLFVVMTLIALWLGWELNFIRARQARLREHPGLATFAGQLGMANPVRIVASGNNSIANFVVYGDLVLNSNSPLPTPSKPPRGATIPWWRTALGDKAVSTILDNGFADQERARLASLFAEAKMQPAPKTP